MTRADVEARLIDAARVWLRLEGGGGSCWATDAPWYLSRRIVDERKTELRNSGTSEKRYSPADDAAALAAVASRPPRPDRDAITQAEEAIGWLGLIPDEDTRRLVALVLRRKASGNRREIWAGLGDPATRGAASLAAQRRRYGRALGALAAALSGRVGAVGQKLEGGTSGILAR